VIVADQPGEPALRRLLRAVDPGLTLVRAETLAGGVSARVTRIDAVRADGRADTLVLRQYGAANVRGDPRCAAHDSELLAALPNWDLYAAMRHAGRMGEWQLSPEDLERLRSGHREFTAAVLAQFPRRGRSARMA
jgi:hypothetical protein